MLLTRKTAVNYSGLMLLSVIWGLAFVAIKEADEVLSPVNLALLRWIVASFLFLALLPIIGRAKSKLERKDLPRLLVVAFSNVVGYHISLNYAETSISAGLSGLLISFGPVFIVLLSVLLLNEKAGRKVLVALVLAIVGALILSVGSISLSDFASLYGPVEVALSALFYAMFSVLGKPLVSKYGSAPTTIWAGVLGTAMMLPLLSTSFISQVESMPLNGWISVLYLSILSTVLGYTLFYTLIRHKAVSTISIQLYLAPIVSVVGGVILLGESVTTFTVIGGALMLAAVALATKH
ncbi:MAG TPA: EamA family transporter [Candidatus Acidoferrales bacterium]|nr:EamA family transporter [Candidatus Acidoferrales bacterium]